MLSAFVSKQDFDKGQAFVIVIDEDGDFPQTSHYLSPAQVDDLCDRLQLAKLSAMYGPAEYR